MVEERLCGISTEPSEAIVSNPVEQGGNNEWLAARIGIGLGIAKVMLSYATDIENDESATGIFIHQALSYMLRNVLTTGSLECILI